MENVCIVKENGVDKAEVAPYFPPPGSLDQPARLTADDSLHAIAHMAPKPCLIAGGTPTATIDLIAEQAPLSTPHMV